MLAQVPTDAESNEITAVPALPTTSSAKGAIFTTDAMTCQRAIARQTIDQEVDCCLALKGIQGTSHDDPATRPNVKPHRPILKRAPLRVRRNDLDNIIHPIQVFRLEHI